MSNIIRTSLLSAAMALSLGASAQLPTVDVSLVQTAGNQLEVIIRPDAFFDGFFAAVVFTIRWQESDGANLGTIQQDQNVQDYMNVNKSGPEQVSGPYRYQVFAGFGGSPLFDLATSWSPGEEIVLCRVNILNSGSFFVLSDDQWTEDANGSYFISLNGVNSTGEIYSFSTDVQPLDVSPSLVYIWPNPNDGQFELVLGDVGEGSLHMEILDAAGRVVWESAGRDMVPGQRTTLDLRGQAAGVYLLKAYLNDEQFLQRIVVQGR
jgi:hypothetical protein